MYVYFEDSIKYYVVDNYQYREETTEDWSRVSNTIARGYGDCEDLAFLEASLAIHALNQKEANLGTRTISLEVGDLRSGNFSGDLSNYLQLNGYINADGTKIRNLPEHNLFVERTGSISLSNADYRTLRQLFNNNQPYDIEEDYDSYISYGGGHMLAVYTDQTDPNRSIRLDAARDRTYTDEDGNIVPFTATAMSGLEMYEDTEL